MTTAAATRDVFGDYWKDDFVPLQAAGASVNAALRADEQDSDLYRRICNGAGAASHLYFPSYCSDSQQQQQQQLPPPEQQLQHLKSVPLPPLLAQQLGTVRMHSSMGLLAAADLAWMSVDDKLYLWSYNNSAISGSTSSSFCSFAVPSGQCVVAVGLVLPKKGVFKSTVEWCLVVATPDEVLLCALVRASTPPPVTFGSSSSPSTPRYMDHGDSSLQLVPTSFSLPTERTRILSVTGTANGRIFLGADDGCLYEMTYDLGNNDATAAAQEQALSIEERLDQFYDQGRNLPDVVSADYIDSRHVAAEFVTLGKRAWTSLRDAAAGSDSSPRPRKCAKVNRTASVSAAVKAVVPDFIVRGTSFIFGGAASAAGGKIVQMVVDEARGCLYTLSWEGWICAFALSGGDVRLAAVMDGSRTARLYLEAVSRGQGFPPVSHSSHAIGNITFPGGGVSAQAGVGGMEGARAILKLEDFRRGRTNGSSASNSSKSSSILKPVSIHVVSPTESSRLTLVAVTDGGLRLYLSSLASHVLSNGPNAIVGGRYGNGSRYRNPLAPSNRLTLCHIRAPPPTDSSRHYNQDLSADSCGVVGGVAPRVLGTKLARVHAASYSQGVFIAAVMMDSEPSNSGSPKGQQRRQPVGDIIVATCPDSVARKVEPQMSPSDDKKNDKARDALVVLGGITESMSLPMSTAYGGNDPAAKLPGGIVWDIAEVLAKASAVMNLTANSTTPTESELGIGLPPAYFPPFKMQSRDLDQTPTHGGVASALYGSRGDSDSNTTVARNSPISKTSLKVLGNVLTNLLLSRPVRHGLTSDQPLDRGSSSDYDSQTSYRVSKRDASRGFSETAAEESSRAVVVQSASLNSSPAKASPSSRSARLRPWLLRPSTVPLNYLSTHFYSQAKEMVALNAGGLHYFGFITVLSRLADALIAASENVADDSAITSLFNGYGFKEGCCMCLALAIGCGPAGGNVSEQVRSRAAAAALARAYVPKLIAHADQGIGPIMSGVAESTDPLVPLGYDFKGSALCEGLTALFSRLVRPIWHKPAVVVTEGRTVKRRWSSKTTQTPAKVEILLDEATLEEIGGLLRNLLNLMKTVFSRAIKTVPGAVPQHANVMDIDENGDDLYLTRALQYSSHLRGGTGGLASQLSPFEAEHIARLLEEKNIHSLYRLLSRLVQLLNLMSLLRRAQSMVELREVEWGLLHGLTTSQLVQTSEGQDRLESLLNLLVTASAFGRSHVAVVSAQADQLANLFAEQCYLFFSPASRFAYLGLRKAAEALSLPVSSSSRVSLANQAAQHLRQAAQHWHSAPLVTGRILQTKGKETFYQIARRAMQYGSPLAKAAEALMDLEDVANVVEVCLIAAANFRSDGSSGRRSVDSFVPRSYELSWEQHLYHKRRDEPPQDGSGVAPYTPSSKQSSAEIIAYGTEVTGRDAVDTCYSLIFYHLSSLLDSKTTDLADSMVSACAAASDAAFLERFFAHLLENDYADTLLRIDSPALDKWLQDRKEPDLLWRYYNVQRRHREAGQVAFDKAKSVDTRLSLSERVEWLSRAVNSFNSALDEGQRGRFDLGSTEDAAQKAKEAGDALHVARLQSRILSSISSSKPNEMTPEHYDRLTNSLVPVSELYNDFAAALSMFEECLLILHACRHDDVRTIQTLWKNVMCEELLPCATRDESTYRFLENFVADIGLTDLIQFLPGTVQSSSHPLFEDGEWEKRLVRRVVSIGKNLYGTGADFVFPVDFILFNLEALKQSAPLLLSPGWSLLTIVDVGVPYLVVMDAYESVTQRTDRILLGGVDMDKHIEKVSATLELLEYWLSLAQSSSSSRTVGGHRNAAYQELSSAMASGRLMRRIESIKAKIEMMPEAATSLLHRLQAIEEHIRYIV